MFDRKSAAYKQLIADIAEAIFSRVDARLLAIEKHDRPPRPPRPSEPSFEIPRLATGILATLTKRERTVLEGIVAGGSNKSIARALGISARTVEVHRGRVMEKLGVSGTAALVSSSIQAGVLPDASLAGKEEARPA